ncbi:MAG: hypothetical protein MJK04_14660 [Psychrosphaera sp.]|nr:hypothetical protein [Psychrosphaera sp.]
MNFIEYKTHVRQIKQGKHLPSAIYLHQSAITQVSPVNLQATIIQTATTLQIDQP